MRGTQSSEGRELMAKEKRELSDERILGGGDFVESVLRTVESEPNRKIPLEEVIDHVERKSGVKFEEIASKSQARHVVKARAMYCHLAKERCGVSGAQLMRQLKLTSGAISHLVYKGRDLFKG
jgi:chromosomal replication initiation ATPase DnaA